MLNFSQPKKASRNDPCPCGSGRKYKKCCLDKDLNENRAKEEKDYWDEVREDEELTLSQLASRKVISWMADKHEDIIFNANRQLFGHHDREKAAEIFQGEIFLNQMVNEYALLDYEDQSLDQTLLSLFLKEKAQFLEQPELATLLAKLNSYKTLYEVQKVVPDQGLWLKDYFSGEKFYASEISGTKTMKKWDIIFARIENFDSEDGSAITGAVVSFPRDADVYLNDLKDQYREDQKLFRPGSEEWLFNFRHLMTPMIFQNLMEYYLQKGGLRLMNKDGDDVVFCVFSSPIKDYGKLLKFFQSHELLKIAFEDGRKKIFHWRDQDDSIMAEFRLKRKSITIETNSRKRLKIIENNFLEGIKDWVGEWRLEEKSPDSRKSIGGEGRKIRLDTHFIASDSRKEAEEIVAQKIKDYYQEWLDMSIPALDGLTPRQASQRDDMKEKLINLLKYMENLGERSRNIPKIDIEKIKKELGVKY